MQRGDVVRCNSVDDHGAIIRTQLDSPALKAGFGERNFGMRVHGSETFPDRLA